LSCPSHFWRFETLQNHFHFGNCYFAFWRNFFRQLIVFLKAWNFNFVERECAGHFLAKFPQKTKRKKKRLEFLFVGTGGVGRDKKEVKGRAGREGRGGGPLKMRHLFHLCLSLLLPAAVAKNANQKNPKAKKKSSTENSSSGSPPPPPPPPPSALPCSGCNQNLGFLMADCLSAAVDLVIRTDGHQLGNHKMATIAPIRCSFRISSSSSPSSSCSSEFSCSFSSCPFCCFLTTS
jgi:hypothetical protein